MFCSECGTKNKKGAAFCENCGSKLKQEEKKEDNNKEIKQTKNAKNNQGKLIAIICGTAFVFLIIICCIISNQFKPESIVKKYMKALSTDDYKTLYKYDVNIEDGDKTFTSFKSYKLIKEKSKPKNILNYQVGKAEYDLGKLTSIVVVNYTEEGSTETKKLEIKLTKSNKKKFIFFDKWIMSNSYTDIKLVKDYKITVPKDSKVVFAGVEVNKKYLSKKDSTKLNDVYILNQVLPSQTPIKVTLKNGIVSETTTTPYLYGNGYKFYLTIDNITKELKDKISKQAVGDLNDFYNGIVEKKEFNKLTNKNFDKKIEEVYNNYSKKLDNLNYKLKKLDFTSAEVTRLSDKSDGTVMFVLYGKYNYLLDEGLNKNKNSSTYIYLTYDISGKNYKLVNIDSLPVYFYR